MSSRKAITSTTQPTIIYFNSGAIGEFLMTLHFASLLNAEVLIPVRRNAILLSELAAAYPHVTVVDLAGSRLWKGVMTLVRHPGPRIVLTQQTFSRHPLSLILLAYIIARTGQRGSHFIPFNDRTRITTLLADELWEFDTNTLFPEAMCVLAKRFGYQGNCLTPHLRLSDNSPLPGREPGAYIVFHLRAFTAERTPAIGQWHRFIEDTRKAFPDITFLFTGTDADASYINAATEGIAGCERVTGEYSMTELARLLAHARAYVGPDTGITHLAAFVGTPSIIVGTRSTPCWWATYGPEVTWLSEAVHCTCVGVKTNACRVLVEGELRFRCMVEVSPEAFIEALTARIHGQ